MSVNLIHSQPGPDNRRRVIRLMADANQLARLSKAELYTLKADIERARDALSRILDRADGKNV